MTESRSRSTDRRYYGVAEAIVTEVNDPEHEGRVRVRYPWFDDKTISDWCRVRQEYTGGGYGAFFVPEVGNEVLVAFVHGDLRLPVILGGLYNGTDKPSTYRNDGKDEKLIRTRAGHELLFDDRSGGHRLHLKTPAGHKAELNDKDKKVTVSTTGGHEIMMDDTARKVTVKTSSGQSVELDGNSGTITITGATITLESSTINLGSGAGRSLVVGEALMTLFNAHTHICTAPGSPSAPPVPPMTGAEYAPVLKTT